MIVVCYHNGALGHCLSALFDCCTQEGGAVKFPSFSKGEHLHNHTQKSFFYKISHPTVDIEKEINNVIVSSSSNTEFGRLLALYMGIAKWSKQLPDFNVPTTFNQGTGSFGNQIEILSTTLSNKLDAPIGWFLNADYVFDILWYWEDPGKIVDFLKLIGLSPIENRVIEFTKLVTDSNQMYFDLIKNYYDTVEDICNQKDKKIDLTFFDTAIVHMLYLKRKQLHINDVDLLVQQPKSTLEFRNIIKENYHGN